jgi:hypothetical protein
VDSAFPKVSGVDSRFRGNDCGLERACLANDTTTEHSGGLTADTEEYGGLQREHPETLDRTPSTAAYPSNPGTDVELFAGASEWQFGPIQIRRPSSTSARPRASTDLPRPQPLHGMGQQLLRSSKMVGRYAFKKDCVTMKTEPQVTPLDA